jgi:hypothetical protein
MTRRSHQTESTLSAYCRARSINRSARGSHRVLINVTMRGRIGVEVADGVSYSHKMFRRMRAQQFDLVGSDRFAPFPTGMAIL